MTILGAILVLPTLPFIILARKKTLEKTLESLKFCLKYYKKPFLIQSIYRYHPNAFTFF